MGFENEFVLHEKAVRLAHPRVKSDKSRAERLVEFLEITGKLNAIKGKKFDRAKDKLFSIMDKQDEIRRVVGELVLSIMRDDTKEARIVKLEDSVFDPAWHEYYWKFFE